MQEQREFLQEFSYSQEDCRQVQSQNAGCSVERLIQATCKLLVLRGEMMKKRFLCRICGKETPEKKAVFIDYGGAVKKIAVLCRNCYEIVGFMFTEEYNYHKENPKAD